MAKTSPKRVGNSALREELRALRLSIERDQRFERHWRALDVLIQPVSGFGLFALGLSLPMILGAFDHVGGFQFWSDLVFGVLLMLVALGAIFLPIQLQGFFLSKPARIKSFFEELEANPNKNPIAVMRQWAARQGDAGKGVRAAIAQLDWALRAGFAALAVAALALVALYLAFVSLVLYVNYQHRPVLTVIATAIGLLLAFAALWLYLRRQKRFRTP